LSEKTNRQDYRFSGARLPKIFTLNNHHIGALLWFDCKGQSILDLSHGTPAQVLRLNG
jgi:hypothetical protein